MDEQGQLTSQDLEKLNSRKGLKKLLAHKEIDIEKVLQELEYEEELEALQIELVKLHKWVRENRKRILIIFEGRDTAGKGGTILRFTQNLNPRQMRIVALPKPSDTEAGQWYFQRYIKELPNVSEMVFFDRSWYNRAVVEPVLGFCNESQYQEFMQQVPAFEQMLYQDGIILIKFWFILDKKEQAKRLAERREDPLKQWKISSVDEKAQKKWDNFTQYIQGMLSKTNSLHSPWVLVDGNNKQKARLETIRYVLSSIDYEGKDKAKVSLIYNPKIVYRYEDAYTGKV